MTLDVDLDDTESLPWSHLVKRDRWHRADVLAQIGAAEVGETVILLRGLPASRCRIARRLLAVDAHVPPIAPPSNVSLELLEDSRVGFVGHGPAERPVAETRTLVM